MNRVTTFSIIGLTWLCATAFSAQERSIHLTNQIRVGYDDNVYHDRDKDSTAYIKDILQISAKAVFSGRTDLLVYYQPEITYRSEASDENKDVQRHLLYAQLNHAISERVFLGITDRFNYRGDDERTEDFGKYNDLAYWENNAQASLSLAVNALSQLTVAGGYELRRWNDDDYAEWQDYDKYFGSATYRRELHRDTTYGYVGAKYENLDYDAGLRGEYEVITGYGGIGHNFTPNVNGSINAGYSKADVEGTSDTQTSAPYISGSIQYNPSARTALSASISRSLTTSDNSCYNIQEATSFNVGLRHDFTARISGVASFGYTISEYDSDQVALYTGKKLPDNNEDYLRFTARLSYEINRMNFVDIGYEFTTRDSDIYQDWSRNRVDIGWRLKL